MFCPSRVLSPQSKQVADRQTHVPTSELRHRGDKKKKDKFQDNRKFYTSEKVCCFHIDTIHTDGTYACSLAHVQYHHPFRICAAPSSAQTKNLPFNVHLYWSPEGFTARHRNKTGHKSKSTYIRHMPCLGGGAVHHPANTCKHQEQAAIILTVVFVAASLGNVVL